MATMTSQHGGYFMYRVVKKYFKTLASSTYIGFHEGHRQFIYKF